MTRTRRVSCLPAALLIASLGVTAPSAAAPASTAGSTPEITVTLVRWPFT